MLTVALRDDAARAVKGAPLGVSRCARSRPAVGSMVALTDRKERMLAGASLTRETLPFGFA